MRKQIVILLVLTFLIADAFCKEARPHHFVSGGPFGLADLRTRSGTTSFYLSPVDLYSIYNVPYGPTAGAGKTIAIVVAYGASTIEADFGNVTTLWGLPACTTANGCFSRVNQTGGTIYPPDDASWSTEAALDLTAAHTMAWGAKKLMVVANSAYSADMFAAIAYAAQHADYVTMSFGWAEQDSIPALQFYASMGEPIFSAGAASFFASTGDVGLLSYPASSANVIAVGGTSLNVSDTNNAQLIAETAWDGTGGGCSNISVATTYQAATPGYSSLGCKGYRAAPDVAFPAELSSGVIIYMSVGCMTPGSCYFQSGGTSLATPLFAGRAAVRGVHVDSKFVYSGNIRYRDITSGYTQYFSTKTGLDLVTGLGSWVGDTTPATPAPTSTPKPPTLAPTPKPATSSPTRTPTLAPTMPPTIIPTIAPSQAPTDMPTISPTAPPTGTPTVSPTAVPTPSKVPTPKPATPKPPTPKPATPKPATPTPKPATATPTPKPATLAPTPMPSFAPTSTPTGTPTPSPTMAPTGMPTSAPSSTPTSPPTSLGYLINRNFPTSALTATSLSAGATIYMAALNPSTGPTVLQRWMYNATSGYIYLRDYPSIVIGAQNISYSTTTLKGTYQVTPYDTTSSSTQLLNEYTQQITSTYYIFRNQQITDHVLSVPIVPSGNTQAFGETYVNNAYRQMWSWGSFQCAGSC